MDRKVTGDNMKKGNRGMGCEGGKIYDLFLIYYFTVRTTSMFRFKIQSVLRNILLLRL